MNDASDDGRPASDPSNPYPGYAAMRSACPVRAVASGSHGRDSYLVTGYAEARQALCDVRFSKDTAAFFAGKGSSAGTSTFRFTTEAMSLGGTEIPAGVPVLVALGAANRDPERFTAPDRLDLDREATGHLSFGHGIHRCVGAPRAKAEAHIALHAILTRFPDIRLAVPADQLDWRQTRLIRGLSSLPVLL